MPAFYAQGNCCCRVYHEVPVGTRPHSVVETKASKNRLDLPGRERHQRTLFRAVFTCVSLRVPRFFFSGVAYTQTSTTGIHICLNENVSLAENTQWRGPRGILFKIFYDSGRITM